MRFRAPSSDDDDESELPAAKRHKTEEQRSTIIASLNVLNDDCLHVILSHLKSDDLNSIAICNRRLCQLRSHCDFDQSRSGTIICSVGSSIVSLYKKIVEKEWSNIFSGN